MTRAIVLLSGGVDSALVLAIAQEQRGDVTAVGFNYGQRHRVELASARKIAAFYGVKFVERSLPMLTPLSARTNYFPQRNTIFLINAVAYLEGRGGGEVYYGPTLEDTTDYPDCRPEFVERINTLVEYAQVQVKAPLITMSKVEVVLAAIRQGVPLHLTWSCYNPHAWCVGPEACGKCAACSKRRDSFAAANVADTTVYRQSTLSDAELEEKAKVVKAPVPGELQDS